MLFERYFERICRFFYTKADADVEDLIQQTFLACVESKDRFRKDSAFFTFLFGVARNVLRVHYRKRKRDERIDFGTHSLHDLAPSPSNVVAGRKEQRLLVEALRRIPIDLQIAVELHFWEGMSARQIGEVLEIPEGTAKSRLRRGKELVREELAKLEPRMLDTTMADLERWASGIRHQLPAPPPTARMPAEEAE